MIAKSAQPPSRAPRERLGSLAYAALIIVVSLATTFAWRFGWVGSPGLGTRLTMALVGAYLMYTGNAIPKSLQPFGCLPHDSAAAQTFRRFAGWTWVLTGIALIGVWFMAPLTPALIFTLTGVPLAIALVILKRRTLARG